MLGLTGLPAVVELLLLPWFPESPRYLLIQRGDHTTARTGKTQDNPSTEKYWVPFPTMYAAYIAQSHFFIPVEYVVGG